MRPLQLKDWGGRERETGKGRRGAWGGNIDEVVWFRTNEISSPSAVPPKPGSPRSEGGWSIICAARKTGGERRGGMRVSWRLQGSQVALLSLLFDILWQQKEMRLRCPQRAEWASEQGFFYSSQRHNNVPQFPEQGDGVESRGWPARLFKPTCAITN